jgi:hypothetical protein
VSASPLLCQALWFASQPAYTGGRLPLTLPEKLWWVSLATLAAVVTALAGTLTSMLEGERVVVSKDPAATVMAAGSVTDNGLDEDNDPTAPAISEAAASSMLEKGKRNKSGTKDIDIQAFYVGIATFFFKSIN